MRQEVAGREAAHAIIMCIEDDAMRESLIARHAQAYRNAPSDKDYQARIVLTTEEYEALQVALQIAKNRNIIEED